MSNADIALTDLPRKLREITGSNVEIPTYRMFHAKVLNGTVPAERRNGRWHIKETVVRELANDLLGRGRRA